MGVCPLYRDNLHGKDILEAGCQTAALEKPPGLFGVAYGLIQQHFAYRDHNLSLVTTFHIPLGDCAGPPPPFRSSYLLK
jgi:hypothetical protein